MMGLIQEVVAAGTQVERAMEITRLINKNAPLGVQATKTTGRKFIEAGESEGVAAIEDLRKTVMNTKDAAEGIRSFMERREANFLGE